MWWRIYTIITLCYSFKFPFCLFVVLTFFHAVAETMTDIVFGIVFKTKSKLSWIPLIERNQNREENYEGDLVVLVDNNCASLFINKL